MNPCGVFRTIIPSKALVSVIVLVMALAAHIEAGVDSSVGWPEMSLRCASRSIGVNAPRLATRSLLCRATLKHLGPALDHSCSTPPSMLREISLLAWGHLFQTGPIIGPYLPHHPSLSRAPPLA